ncbi:MAG TPA: hypothetical protein VL443_09150 [Cyclobacteriaceae bacterium]|nr:hypothetical protein [Cyclobacteriaceae bacterium]
MSYELSLSSTETHQRIGSILSDTILLDVQFNFISISHNILESTGYSHDELLGSPFSILSRRANIQKLLEEKLNPGSFQNEHIEIQSKSSGTIMYAVSGFYLNQLSNSSELILLKLRNLDEINLMYDRLEAKTAGLDRFVYLSAHSLRGPLATIKGLINLAKISRDPVEMNFLMTQLDSYAEQLDDKLHRLIYFAESDKEYESEKEEISFTTITESLKSNSVESSIDHPVSLNWHADEPFMILDNGKMILSLLRNLIQFFCQQPKSNCNTIQLDAHVNKPTIEITLKVSGFLLGEVLQEKLRCTSFGYSEILNHPELINCYAAKKIIFKLKGNIQFTLLHSGDVVVLMTLPRNTQLALF